MLLMTVIHATLREGTAVQDFDGELSSKAFACNIRDVRMQR
jgi:hypothetical protein